MANTQKDCVVKRRGHQEKYNSMKVYASCYAAALNCHYTEKKSEAIADNVTKKVNAWIKKGKSCVDSTEIKRQVIKNLQDKDVALMYKHYLDLS